MNWIGRTFRRAFEEWEKEIVRPIFVTLATAFVLFSLSLLFAPVRQFLFDHRVPYPIYCTAESYSTSADSARTEIVLINTTSVELSRSDLENALESAEVTASPDLQFVYTREIGTIVSAEPDAPFNQGKGEVTVRRDGQTVEISPHRLTPRAIIRVNIDVIGLPDDKLTRAAHDFVPFRVATYEEACYTR